MERVSQQLVHYRVRLASTSSRLGLPSGSDNDTLYVGVLLMGKAYESPAIKFHVRFLTVERFTSCIV